MSVAALGFTGFVDTRCLGEEVSAMPKRRPPCPAEFRRQMVVLVWSGHSLDRLAREFEPSASRFGTGESSRTGTMPCYGEPEIQSKERWVGDRAVPRQEARRSSAPH